LVKEIDDNFSTRKETINAYWMVVSGGWNKKYLLPLFLFIFIGGKKKTLNKKL